MKELTIEQKVRAYDEAVKEAYIAYKDEDKHLKATLERIFPELKESEDDRIRKKLIEAIKGDMVVGGAKDKQCAIAWLEKQGNKPQGKSALEAIWEEKVDNANKIEPKDYSSIDPHFCKPIDNVEPKLKIEKDKWYVCIRDLYDNYGTKAFCKGSTYYSTKDETLLPDNSNIPFEIKYCVNDYFRPWTIQDAKVGDVLATEDKNFTTPFVAIYKSIGDTVYDNITFNSHCFIGFDGNFYGGEEGHTIEDIHPATKKQCDLMFQKMKEAGYKWNVNKKELIKEEVK